MRQKVTFVDGQQRLSQNVLLSFDIRIINKIPCVFSKRLVSDFCRSTKRVRVRAGKDDTGRLRDAKPLFPGNRGLAKRQNAYDLELAGFPFVFFQKKCKCAPSLRGLFLK